MLKQIDATTLYSAVRFNVLPVSMLALRQDFRSGDVTVGRQVLMPGYPGIGDQLADRPILVGGVEDVAALVEVNRDAVLRQWSSSVVDDDADGTRWVKAQQQGWAAGDRFGFAVLEAQPGSVREQLVGNVVLKEVSSGKPAAEVGSWTAAHARGRGVASRALEALTSWAFDSILPAAPASFPRDGHPHIRRRSV